MSNPKTAPDLRLGSFCYLPRALSWGGVTFHMCTNRLLKFYKAPLAGKDDHCLSDLWPQGRGTCSLKQSGNVPLKPYTAQPLQKG